MEEAKRTDELCRKVLDDWFHAMSRVPAKRRLGRAQEGFNTDDQLENDFNMEMELIGPIIAVKAPEDAVSKEELHKLIPTEKIEDIKVDPDQAIVTVLDANQKVIDADKDGNYTGVKYLRLYGSEVNQDLRTLGREWVTAQLDCFEAANGLKLSEPYAKTGTKIGRTKKDVDDGKADTTSSWIRWSYWTTKKDAKKN
jgi:hypothetical protein